MSARDPSQDDVLLVGMAGGSGSGKSTISNWLVDEMPGQVGVLQHDAYYRHCPELTFEERAAVNYDHPASLDTSLLIEHLEALRAGESVKRPTYDFSRHLRGEEVVIVDPAPVIVVEGILVPPDGSVAYVAATDDDNVAIVDLRSLAPVGKIEPGSGPDGMAWIEGR